MAHFEGDQGISWQDADGFYWVVADGQRVLYYRPDRDTAQSIADYAQIVYGRPFTVHGGEGGGWSRTLLGPF